MLVQKEVRKSIWITCEFGDSIFGLFLFKNFYHNVTQLHRKSFFLLGHTSANTCKENCSHFRGQPACPKGFNGLRSWATADVTAPAGPAATCKGTEETSLGIMASPSVGLHKHPEVGMTAISQARKDFLHGVYTLYY